MIFIETPVFTKRLSALLDDDRYAAFQRELVMRPDMGDVIEGTGGLRKVRVASKGHGKRGGDIVGCYDIWSCTDHVLFVVVPATRKEGYGQ